MEIEKNIRKQAKNSLKGKWVTAVSALFVIFAFILLVYLFYSGLCYIFNVFNSQGNVRQRSVITLSVIIFISILLAFLLSPIKNGFLKLCYNIANNRKIDFRDIFYFFIGIKTYFKALKFNFYIFLKGALYFIIGFIPYLILNILNFTFIELFATVEANKIYFILQTILFAAGVTFGIIFYIKLIISEFLFADNENTDIVQISKVTKAITKKHHKDLILLIFTFLPWIAFCFFVLPALYVIPYFTTSLATSSKWLIKLYKDGKIL